MRSGTRLAGLALLLTACGNYSTDDIAFIEALPTREDLQVALPQKPAAAARAGAPAAASVVCANGVAREFVNARATGVAMNSALDWILTIVDTIRTLPPSERHRDQRVWGPFPDQHNPGFVSRAVVTRSQGAGGVPSYAFSLETHNGTDHTAWTPIISGDFVGASGRTGRGDVTLHFANIWALGLQHKPDDPQVDITIAYDRRSDPRTLSVAIPPGQDGFGLVSFDYGFALWASGAARLDFAVVDARGRFVIAARFDALGAGAGDVTIYPASPPPASYAFSLCWDGDGCVTAVDDPWNLGGYCPGPPGPLNPCLIAGPCPTVP